MEGSEPKKAATCVRAAPVVDAIGEGAACVDAVHEGIKFLRLGPRVDNSVSARAGRMSASRGQRAIPPFDALWWDGIVTRVFFSIQRERCGKQGHS